MFSMGPGELIIIMIVVLVVVGPEKLPEFARTIARAIRDFKRYGEDVRKEFEEDLFTDDIKRDLDAIKNDQPADYSYAGPSNTREEDVDLHESEGQPEDYPDESGSDAEGDGSAENDKEDHGPVEEPPVDDPLAG